MKFLLVVSALLLTYVNAEAATQLELDAARKACAFGETTADLTEQLELATGHPSKIWYKGEHLSLSKKERLNGLSAYERKMIMMVINRDGRNEEEALQDFSSSDGYITYFSHISNSREFAMVASFPGDNEYGAIVELKQLHHRGEFSVIHVVAVISDGDLDGCKVVKSEVGK